MADLSVTAANVVAAAGATINRGPAGATITAGQQVYIDSSGNVQLAKADTAAHAASAGIALNGGAAGQPICYASGGNVNPGATVAVGTIYIASPNNAGGIAPIGDATTGTYMTVLGIGTTTSNILLNIWNTGVDHA